MPTLPTAQDMTKAREQAGQAIEGAVHQARTPLMAALGAGDLAAHAVADTVKQVRQQLNDSAESARAGVGDLPGDLTGLRSKLTSAELRKLVDTYTNSAVRIYGYLADRGENAFGRLQEQPQVQRAVNQVGTAQERFEGAVGDARGLADDVLGRVSTTTRSFGEKAARSTEATAADTAATVQDATADTAATVQSAAADTAEAVQDAGAKAATTTRSTAGKAANRAAEAKSNGSTTAAKNNGSAKQPKSAARKNTGN